DVFELVEVDEHDRKRATGTRSALPLRRQRFPEEPAGLYAREAVSGRLLLQVLGDEGGGEGGGGRGGPRAHGQYELGGKGVFLAALDIQHAEQRFAVGDRDAENGARIGQHADQVTVAGILHEGALVRTSHAAYNPDAQRNALAA